MCSDSFRIQILHKNCFIRIFDWKEDFHDIYEEHGISSTLFVESLFSPDVGISIRLIYYIIYLSKGRAPRPPLITFVLLALKDRSPAIELGSSCTRWRRGITRASEKRSSEFQLNPRAGKSWAWQSIQRWSDKFAGPCLRGGIVCLSRNPFTLSLLGHLF